MLRKNNAHSDSMVTVTSETFSISGVDHPIITKMNSFHDKLADQLLTEKEFSFVKDVDEDDDLDEDDVFTEPSPQPETEPRKGSAQPAPNPDTLAMNDFARVWAQSIRRSQYREQIFHGLSELTMIESRRDKIISNFEVYYASHDLKRLKCNVQM